MKVLTIDGNEACAKSAYMFSDIAGIYPITPSSGMAEHIDEWASKGETNIFDMPVKVVEMQSEAGAAGFVHGALNNGSIATTFTASQGLLLMIPNMYKIAGEMLPCVINVAARSIATHALSILGDHQDIYAIRPTGFAILASSSVQSVSDLTIVSYLSSIKASLPFVNFFDGFRTSHELNKINVLEKEDIIDLIDFKKINEFRNKGLSVSNKIKGTAMMEDVYFQMAEVRNKDYLKLPDIVNDYMKKINKKTGKNYAPFEYYGSKTAKKIIVAMGSVCETIREVIDDLDSDLGLIEVHLYRPFSSKYFFDVLPSTVTDIAVLDRTKEPGSIGEPLYLDVVSLFNDKDSKPRIVGGRYGLSSKDTNASHIKAVYDFLGKNAFNGFTIGIEDDVTNLSIPVKEYHTKEEKDEFLIYGYGSDGMISASKDILKLVGNNSDKFVQGYFQYDSKKSGGITRSHIRFSDKPIRSTYYIDNPSLVVCSKESYLGKYDMLSNIRKNGTFIFVTSLSEKEIEDMLGGDIKKILIEKNIKFYTIDAYKLANLCGLKNKISTILEVCILHVLGYDFIDKIKESIENRFLKKGKDVIESNKKAVDSAIEYLKEIKIKFNDIEFLDTKEKKFNKVFDMINSLNGNKLKVSDFKDYKDGSYILGTSEHEKRGIAEYVAVWDKDKCIQCNQCSFVCPHAVIRPFLLVEDELNKAPKSIKDNVRKAIGSKYMYTIGISKLDCTGCSICSHICPSNALKMIPFEEVKNNNFEYLVNKISVKEEQVNNTVKGTQFKKPLFEFSGACAGCGETPYIKLLTQLFGDKIAIANATGCSSIYGASFPSVPYKIPWANSLFEDNAEFGFGMMQGYNGNRAKVKKIMEEEKDGVNKELIDKWLNNYDNYEITKEVYDNLDYSNSELDSLKEYIISRNIWIVGGDGWAYDIGFGGIDHVLSSNENIRILVLDTEVYSNTGGQSSKSSNRGSIAKFTSNGKENAKKDLARIAMCYKNCYVAQVSLANMNAVIKAFNEADKHDGPAIIIAYSHCINHGIKTGMESAIDEQKLAVNSGYFPIFRYDGNIFTMDHKEPDFTLLDKFIDNETRFQALKIVNKEKADILFEKLKQDAKERYEYYTNLVK